MPRLALQSLLLALVLAGCSSAPRSNARPSPQAGNGATSAALVIHIHGISQRRGTINVGVYRNDGTWLTGKDIAFTTVVSIPEEGEVLSVTFNDIPVGEYAVSLYQDVDGSRALEQGALGIPSEPWGMSNDAIGLAAPASFDQAAFTLYAPVTTIDIRLRDGLFLTSSSEQARAR